MFVIHYHGTPITPRPALLALAGRNFCVSYADPRDAKLCHEIGQSVMLDNGAFTFWRQGTPTDWDGYYAWCETWLEYPTTWAVIPDVIDGTEDENDTLIDQWPFGAKGAPVWHLHEPIVRLRQLASEWPRVCLGSSGAYAAVGTPPWHRRMEEAMNELCGNGPVPVWLHMLRGMALAGSDYPFASADSTNIARNHNGSHKASPKDPAVMASRLDVLQNPSRWTVRVSEPAPEDSQLAFAMRTGESSP